MLIESSLAKLYQALRLEHYRNLFAAVREKAGSLSATEAFSAEVIYLLEKPTVGAFADFLGISQPNATYKVNSLVSKGYLTRTSDGSDRRESRLMVTKKFRDYYGQQLPAMSAALHGALSGFTADEVLLLDRLLDRLASTVVSQNSPAAASYMESVNLSGR